MRKIVRIPDSIDSDNRGRTDDYVDLNEIEAFEGYNDGTITLHFKSGRNYRVGPFEEFVWNDFLDTLIGGNNE